MTFQPLISVIIPVYNAESYFKECMASVLCQTYTHLEVILVNDGSTDGSGALCDHYAALDNRVKVIHKENGGVGTWFETTGHPGPGDGSPDKDKHIYYIFNIFKLQFQFRFYM